jgi:hypothetical protein
VIDASGVKLYFTPPQEPDKRRTIKAGTIVLGDPDIGFIGQSIGEGTTKWSFQCPDSCFAEHFQQTATIHGRFYHMHRNGVKMVSRQYRRSPDGSEELIDTVTIDYYSAEQQFNTHAPATFQSNDRWEIDCYMDNDLYAGDNVWGLGSEDEMCMLFLTYYPFNELIESCGYGDGSDPFNCKAQGNYLGRETRLDDLNRAFDTSVADIVCPTSAPTPDPTESPSESPTGSPTTVPSKSPTESPTESPTPAPTSSPTGPPAPVEVVGQIEMVGMSIEEITEDVLAALQTIIADLLGVPEEDVTVRVVETATDRRLEARRVQSSGAIIEYDVAVPPDQGDDIVEMLSNDNFEIDLEGEILSFEDSTLFVDFEGANTFEPPTIITLSPTAAPDLKNEDDSLLGNLLGNLYVLIGIAVGGTVVAVILAIVAVKRSRSSITREKRHIEMGGVQKRQSWKGYNNPMGRVSGEGADVI